MNNKNSEQDERLADQIVEYLARNPLAADTVAGIQSWWLSRATLDINSGDVENAIRILMKRGTLQCSLQPDGTKTYFKPR